MDVCMRTCVDGWMDACMNKWINGWTCGYMGAWKDECECVIALLSRKSMENVPLYWRQVRR